MEGASGYEEPAIFKVAIRSVGNPAVCSLVPCLHSQPTRFGRDDLRTRPGRRSFHHASLGRPLARKLLERFNKRKRSVTTRWHVDETYIGSAASGCTFTAPLTAPVTRRVPSAKTATSSQQSGSSEEALKHHGRPDRIVIDGSRTNREASISCDAENRLRDRSRRPVKAIRIGRDHRRVRSMLGFKSKVTAAIILSGIEMFHMSRKRQARFAHNPDPSIADQFAILTA